MAWSDQTYLIGEKVKVDNEKGYGVITRIDFDRGLIYVLFKRMREEAYPYPEALDQHILKPEVQQK
ncbi:MAG: hypothetical protein WC225_02135 [Acholeplasmataceae bacterium]|nr:hypothetical protein [Acholeplasmataceae bacterium]